MDQRTRNALRHPFGMLFPAALVLIALTACNDGDADEDPATDAVETVEDVAATPPAGSTGIGTPAGIAVASAATPVDVAAGPIGTPVDGSPTPEAVVADPSAAQEASGGTPAAVAVTPSPAANVAGFGDGTGGAGLDVAVPSTSGEPGVVASCDVESYPPYTGGEPSQVTTVEVNFRAGPGTDCEQIGDPLPAGTTVEVLSDPVTREGATDFEWVAVSIGGVEGWLATNFLNAAQ